MEMILKWRDARAERPVSIFEGLLIVTADGYVTTDYYVGKPESRVWKYLDSEVVWWLPVGEIIQLPGVNRGEWIEKYRKSKEDQE